MPAPSGFIKVCRVFELKENAGCRFIVDDVDVAIFKIGEQIYAINNLCPHQHVSILHDGFIEEGYVTCPAHGWQFSLSTGKMPEGRRGVNTFETHVENGDVYVKVYKKELNW